MIFTAVLALWCSFCAYSQEKSSEVCVAFRVNSSEIDPEYGNNASGLREITSIIDNLLNDSTITLKSLSFYGAASPEGNYQINKELARNRLSALEDFVLEKIDVPDSLITRDNGYIPWDYLKSMVEESDISHKRRILEILNGDSEIVDYQNNQKIDSRVLLLKELDRGDVWREMNLRFFGVMRNAYAVFVTYRSEESAETVTVPLVMEQPSDTAAVAIPFAEPSPEFLPVENGSIDRSPRLSLKTNTLLLDLMIPNAAAEIDLCRHLSFSFPAYYSAWDYFHPSLKFRTFSFQPELRYWFSETNTGFFAGAHFTFAYYNIALGRDHRIQDHDGTSPALGGGISLGYRIPISRNSRWNMEFSLGCGVLNLNYDIFRNKPNGLVIDTESKTYFGPDQASVSISYSFDLRRNKVKKEVVR